MKKINLSKYCLFVLVTIIAMAIHLTVAPTSAADEKRAPTQDETRLLQIEYRLLDLNDQRKIMESMLDIAKNKDILFVPVYYHVSVKPSNQLPQSSQDTTVPVPVTRLQLTQAIKAKFPQTTKEEMNRELAQMELFSNTYNDGLKNNLPKVEMEIQNLKEEAVGIRERIDRTTNAYPSPDKPQQGAIRVLKAIYGHNCQRPSDVTAHLAAACNGRQDCKYQVDHHVIGDPAYKCRKDYIYEWQCGDDQTARYRQIVSPEASGNFATLICK
jgi:hypothetical protein